MCLDKRIKPSLTRLHQQQKQTTPQKKISLEFTPTKADDTAEEDLTRVHTHKSRRHRRRRSHSSSHPQKQTTSQKKISLEFTPTKADDIAEEDLTRVHTHKSRRHRSRRPEVLVSPRGRATTVNPTDNTMIWVTVQKVMTFAPIGRFLLSALLLLLLVSDDDRVDASYCEFSELEVSSNRGLKIEPVSQSRVEISLPSTYGPRLRRRRNKFQMQFSFKTKSPNGILFYGRSPSHPGQMLAISLRHGHLVYTIRCPTLYADVTVPTRNREALNDGKWHSLSYTVNYSPAGRNKIEIDRHPNARRYEVTCAPINTVVVGGLSPRDGIHVREFEGLRGKFEGCIRKLHIPATFRRPPKYYAVSVCE